MVDRQVKDTWSVFKIMGEFVEGFETLRDVWPSVSMFGGSRIKRSNPYYRDASRIAESLSQKGFSIITGGGPGVMEAANRGAGAGRGDSIALSIRLPNEQATNEYAETVIEFSYFFARKVMFVKYACGIIGMPGGFGTLDEIFEALTLVQTQKIRDVPVVLFGSAFWSGLVDWLDGQPRERRLISRRDLDLFRVTDDPDEVVDIIECHYAHMQERREVRGNGREIP